MSQTALIATSFVAFLLLFTGVGIYAASRKQSTTEDYLLASRDVNPWTIGLSAFATTHSGGMFISWIGWTYQLGIVTVWPLVGWFVGDYFIWFVVNKRLRVLSEANSSETIGAFLAGGDDRQNRPIAVISAIMTIAFLGTYAAGQLLAGSKALHAIFGWNYNTGIILGTAIILAYCFSGGIRASIWTDALQSLVMTIAMFAMVAVTVVACGGFGGLWQQLGDIDPALTSFMPQDTQYGFGLYLLGWLFAGVGVTGQPHIMVRAMAVDDAKNMGITRNIYAVSYVLFSAAAVLVGLGARVLLPTLMDGGDPELALPQMAMEMLPALGVGVVLAGIFAAVVSTADSQILSCSAALTQDLVPRMSHS
ncbi:MAG: sodium/proline symporter [Geitlerinemataceae cyanobacterium]